jgi:hypothetical protein
MLDRLGKPSRREVSTLIDRALVLVLNRLIAPASEHGLACWLETDFVCDRHVADGCHNGAMRRHAALPRLKCSRVLPRCLI